MDTLKSYKQFRAYCATLTDDQVSHVVERERAGAERDPDREPHYEAAIDEARKRGLS